MIVKLGVDYSIFLMMRYREVEEVGAEGIIEAAKHIGRVVLSAVLILGGTFAALIPSGIVNINASGYFCYCRSCFTKYYNVTNPYACSNGWFY